MEKLGVHVVNTDVVFRLILRKHVATSNSESSGNSTSSANVLATNASQNNVNQNNPPTINSPTARRSSSSFGSSRPGPAPSSFDSTKLFADIAILKTETEDLKRTMHSILMKNSQKDADPTTISSSDNNSIDEVSARYESRIFILEKELKEARELLSKQPSH